MLITAQQQILTRPRLKGVVIIQIPKQKIVNTVFVV